VEIALVFARKTVMMYENGGKFLEKDQEAKIKKLRSNLNDLQKYSQIEEIDEIRTIIFEIERILFYNQSYDIAYA